MWKQDSGAGGELSAEVTFAVLQVAFDTYLWKRRCASRRKLWCSLSPSMPKTRGSWALHFILLEMLQQGLYDVATEMTDLWVLLSSCIGVPTVQSTFPTAVHLVCVLLSALKQPAAQLSQTAPVYVPLAERPDDLLRVQRFSRALAAMLQSCHQRMPQSKHCGLLLPDIIPSVAGFSVGADGSVQDMSCADDLAGAASPANHALSFQNKIRQILHHLTNI